MSFFSFLKPVEHAVGTVAKDAKKVTKSGFNFLAGAERQFNTLDNNATFKNPQGSSQKQSIVRQYVQNLTKEKDFAVSAARSIPRAGATIGKSIADVTNPALGLPVVPAYNPSNPIAEAVLGKEPIKSVQQRSSETQKKLEGSRFHDFAAPLAALGTGLSVGLDAVPVGGPGKKGLEEGITKLAKATTPAEVRKIMKGTDPTLVDEVAHAIATTKDPHIIKNIIDKANNPLPKGPEMLPTPETAAPVPTDIVKATVPEAETNPAQAIVTALRGQAAAKGQSPVRGIESLNEEQKQLYGAERASRIDKATKAGSNLTGRDALYAQLHELKGPLQKVNNDALIEHLQSKVTPDQVNGVLDTLRQSPHLSGYEPVTAQNAVVKLFDEGRLPAPKEWEILNKALGSDFTEAIKSTATETLTTKDKVKYHLTQILGAPKAILSSFDLSGGFRQGGVLGSRFPKQFAKAQKDSAKYFVNPDKYKQDMAEIASRENYDTYKKMGIHLSGVAGHEEQFPSDLAEKIPGVNASERAYVGGLTRLRADAADSIIEDLKKTEASLNDKQLKSLGRFINTSSGRGDLGGFEKYATALGDALFSPRLWKSRLDMLNPIYYKNLKGPARKYALQAASSYASIAAIVLGLATLAGAKVESDARSSDFGKIKVGDTRYDILGGFQQNLVLAWRELSGEKKSSQTGKISDLNSNAFGAADRLSIISDFFQNKENPVVAEAQKQIKGKDISGETLTPKARATSVGNLVVPLNVQDTLKTVKDSSSQGVDAKGVAKGIVKSAPGTFGVGVGTYGVKDLPVTSSQGKYIQKLKNEGASKEKVAATKLFYQVIKSAPSKTETSAKIDKILSDTKIPLDKAVAQAQQIAKDYNNKYYDVIDKAWLSKYKQYGDERMVKDFNKGKLNLTDSAIQKRLDKIKEDRESIGG